MNIHSTLKVTILFALTLLVGLTEVYAKDEIYTSFLSNDAADGYDVVAYFTEGKPVRGVSEFKIRYKGADWYFSSAENLERFTANPMKYAPQYGGYCAWAVANGSVSKGDPTQWTIHNGRLYLNYNESIKNRWLENIDTLIQKGDQNWPGVIQ